MNEEQRKQIDILNAKYFTEFGMSPDGRLRFKWMRTDEMPLAFGRDMEEPRQTESGLWIVSRSYKRRTVADTYGQGLCWTVAYLEPPPTREEWLKMFGTDIPWPANGYYRPIDNIVRVIDLLPDEECSARAAFNIRKHLNVTTKQWMELGDQAVAKQRRDFEKEVADMVDDAAPAFNNNPGGKSHVSLPS